MSRRLGEQVEVLGSSPKPYHVRSLIERLGQNRCSVLITGESGTGKEVVARSIYNKKPEGPFVTIDCSTLVGPLMESELFGHVKGSFTGAVNAKIGLVQLAHNGTAFFDEIGELPLDLQAKLLRVLQEKEYRPVGSLATRRSDFRIIAASNKDLETEVDKGTFRKDLYYRLNVVNVKLSPLRERREDIPALVVHFLKLYGLGHILTEECLEAMLVYDWPGNVRELEHAIEGMTAMHDGPLLHLQDLPETIQRHLALGALSKASVAPNSDVALQDILPLSEMERRMIQRTLEFTNGDMLSAARMLGISRATLYRKVKEHVLER